MRLRNLFVGVAMVAATTISMSAQATIISVSGPMSSAGEIAEIIGAPGQAKNDAEGQNR